MNKLKLNTLLLIFCLIALCSCQKEVSAELEEQVVNPGLLGTWAFAALEAKTVYDISMTEDGHTARTVTKSHYFSKNNSGTLIFESNRIQLSNFSYTIDTTVEVEYYEDGNLELSFEQEFQYDLPATFSQANSYKLVGQDSIYFPTGGMMSVGGDTQSFPSEPDGWRYKLDDAQLTIYIGASFYNKEDIDGMKVTTKGSGTQTLIFQKP